MSLGPGVLLSGAKRKGQQGTAGNARSWCRERVGRSQTQRTGSITTQLRLGTQTQRTVSSATQLCLGTQTQPRKAQAAVFGVGSKREGLAGCLCGSQALRGQQSVRCAESRMQQQTETHGHAEAQNNTCRSHVPFTSTDRAEPCEGGTPQTQSGYGCVCAWGSAASKQCALACGHAVCWTSFGCSTAFDRICQVHYCHESA